MIRYLPKYKYIDTRKLYKKALVKLALASNIAGFELGDRLIAKIEGKWVIFRKASSEDKGVFTYKLSKMGGWKVLRIVGIAKALGWKEGERLIIAAKEGEIAMISLEHAIKGIRELTLEVIKRLSSKYKVKQKEKNKYEVIISKEKRLIVEIPEEVVVIEDVWDVDKVGDYFI